MYNAINLEVVFDNGVVKTFISQNFENYSDKELENIKKTMFTYYENRIALRIGNFAIDFKKVAAYTITPVTL